VVEVTPLEKAGQATKFRNWRTVFSEVYRRGISKPVPAFPIRPVRYNRRMFDRPRVVVVTGSGGSGCGRAIAGRFAGDGAAVVVSDIDEAGGHATVRLIEERGGRAAFFRADVGDELQNRQLMEFAVSTFGGLSVLVNNASSPHPDAEGIAGWRGSLQTDLLGTIYATQWAIETMRRSGGGSIVNISSISALWHGRERPGGFPGYDVAKAGVIRLTAGLAKEAAKDGIRVNCLAPGWIGTEGPRQYWESLTPAQRVERGVPTKLLSTEEVAEMVVRLATDQSLNGRVVVWWSEDAPRLIQWGDRGYRFADEVLSSSG
jgi:NAD(P)-dependent dehydrogenase (short-subunit alcohol dehydrogenase family)